MRCFASSHLASAWLGLFLIAVPVAHATSAKTGQSLEIWLRKPGEYADGTDWPRDHLVTVDLTTKKQTVRTQFDDQYERSVTVRGYDLKSIIADYRKNTLSNSRNAGEVVDTVLMHFANKMLIPIGLNSKGASPSIDKMQLFVARQIKDGSWSEVFPEVVKEDPKYPDPRPLRFDGNKLVVAPAKGAISSKHLAPWRYADSLVGLEFVNWQAWQQQFLVVDTASVKAGHGEFLERCAPCHGVRRIGARYGWDFVDPLPVIKQKTPETLLAHVKYPKWDALERGLMMPVQKDVTAPEIKNLWSWLEAVANHKPTAYKP